jgi:hypothetical protein
LNVSREHDFYQVRPGVIQLSGTEFCPPEFTLTIDCAIGACKAEYVHSQYVKYFPFYFRKGVINIIPVITTSVRLFPKIRLLNLAPSASLPLP